MTITRRRGVGKAGSDHPRENTSPSSASVRCSTLCRYNLGKTSEPFFNNLDAIRISAGLVGVTVLVASFRPSGRLSASMTFER